MIRVIVVTALLLSAAAASAEFDPITAKMSERPQPVEHRLEGRTVEGRLATYTYVPPSTESAAEAQRDDEGVVFLREYLWFPNPFSGPQVVVAVTQESDFVLEMVGYSGTTLETFPFQGVAEGVYTFTLVENEPPTRKCLVRLVLDGEAAGQLNARTRQDHPRK